MKLNEFYAGSADEELLKSLSQENKIIDEEELNKAMNKAGLVQKEVQVRGKNGQTFTRKQWVKASEDIAQPKQASKETEEQRDKAISKLKSMKNYQPGDGIEGNNRVYYAEDHEDGGYFKTTLDDMISGNITGNEKHMSAVEVLKEIDSEDVSQPKQTGSPMKISEDNFPKGSTIYYNGKKATVLRVGKEFSGGGMGIVVRFSNGGTGTIGKSDMKKVSKTPSESVNKKDVKTSDPAPASKVTGKGMADLVRNLKDNGFEMDSADQHSPQDTVTLYKNKQEFTATFNKYSDGGMEVINIKPVNKDSKKEDVKSTESKNFSPHQVGVNNVSAYVNRKKYGDKNWFNNIGAVLAGEEKEFESSTGKKEAIRACKEAIRSHKRGVKDSNYRDSSYTKEHSQKLVDAETKLLSILENTPVKGEQPNKDNNTTDSKDSKQPFELPKDKSGLAKLLESGTSRDDIMSAAKAAGVTWKHSDHPGINWMRASMAITGTTTRGSKDPTKKGGDSTENKKKSQPDSKPKPSKEEQQKAQQFENGEIDKDGNFIVDDKADLEDLVSEVTGTGMFDQYDYAIDALERQYPGEYPKAFIEIMGFDSAKRNKDGSIRVNTYIEGYYGDDEDNFDMNITFDIPVKKSKKIEVKTTNFGGKYEPYSWMTKEENDKLSKIPKYLDKPVDEWGDYSITQGNYHENFSSISELKSALKYRGLPESLANFSTNKFKSEDGYIQNDYRNAGVFAYPQINPEWDKAYDEASKASRSRRNKK